jgi:predicted phage baseplate assembly protein
MPLKEKLPSIDDRSWQQIVDEIRARIPHYTPEWTDLNDNDPGITLAQVFAHLAEMLMYRMNLVPEFAYIKFLELIGIELTPARPARAEISFTVAEDHPDATVLVPRRTQVSAAAEDGTPFIFETERALTAVALRLRAVQAYDGAQYRDATAANAAPVPDQPRAGFDPFGIDPRADGALVLGFGFPDSYPTPNTFPPLALDLAFFVQSDPGQPLVQKCGAPATRAYAPARLTWEGFDGTQWLRLDALNDETLAFTRSGHVVVRIPNNVSLARVHLGEYTAQNPDTGEEQPPLFWLRARLTDVQYEAAPRLLAVRTNTVPALQARTLRDEVLGGTSGDRAQTFEFSQRPVLNLADSPVLLEIDEGQGPQPWKVVDDLFASGPRDRHAVVNWAAGELVLGDGENGAVPVANAANRDANVIVREYRSGGGEKGNVGAGQINVLVTQVAGLDTAGTTNLFAAAGGSDEETLDAAKKRARQSLRARDRAVTPEDFELLAKEAGQVARAKALPLAHPQFPGTAVPGAVTVIVVPQRREETVPPLGTPPPLPSDALLRTVCEYLDARRLLTTELFVVAPQYLRLAVRARVVARDDADTLRMHDEVETALRTYFDPLRGGDDGTGWPFGGALRYSKIVQRVFNVDGVDSVPELVLTLDDEERPVCTDVALGIPNALLHLVAHDIEVVTQREAEALA